MHSNEPQNPQLNIGAVSGSVCHLCGFVGTELEPVYTDKELEY